MAENQETANERSKDASANPAGGGDGARPKPLPEAAKRALAEAEARRNAADEEKMAREIGGRKDGPEPTRYGDWENKGILSDL